MEHGPQEGEVQTTTQRYAGHHDQLRLRAVDEQGRNTERGHSRADNSQHREHRLRLLAGALRLRLEGRVAMLAEVIQPGR